MKGNANSDIDSTLAKVDLTKVVVAVSVQELEVNTRTVLSWELPMPILLVFNDAIPDFFPC